MNPDQGSIYPEGDRASIVFERRLPHSIEEVWEALTDPEQLSQWLGHVAIDPRTGGTIAVEAGPKEIPVELRRTVGQILVWDPPRVLEYEWRQAIIEDSTLRFELSDDEDGTTLKLVHRWLSIRNAGGFVSGWHAYLDRLTAYLDGDAENPEWEQRVEQLRPLYG